MSDVPPGPLQPRRRRADARRKALRLSPAAGGHETPERLPPAADVCALAIVEAWGLGYHLGAAVARMQAAAECHHDPSLAARELRLAARLLGRAAELLAFERVRLRR